MYRWSDHDEKVLEWMGKESAGGYGYYASVTWEAYRLLSELKSQSQPPKRYVFTWQASGYGRCERDALVDAKSCVDLDNPTESKQED